MRTIFKFINFHQSEECHNESIASCKFQGHNGDVISHAGFHRRFRETGCEAPFVRPEPLARDDSSSMDAIMHALDALEENYDYLLLLQPTSPFRTSEHIDEMIAKCIDANAKLMISVSKVKKHPSFMYELEGSHLRPVLGTYVNQQRRQESSGLRTQWSNVFGPDRFFTDCCRIPRYFPQNRKAGRGNMELYFDRIPPMLFEPPPWGQCVCNESGISGIGFKRIYRGNPNRLSCSQSVGLNTVKSYNVPEAMAYEMLGHANIDIDDNDDWEYAEYLIATGKTE